MDARKRIAIIDDAEDNRLILRRLFEREFQVTEYSDGASALESLAVSPPDLLLLDICMPGMNGFEVLKQLRSDRRFENVIVVAFTASARPDEAARYQIAGFDYLICKPVIPQAVVGEVRALLQVRAMVEGMAERSRDRSIRC